MPVPAPGRHRARDHRLTYDIILRTVFSHEIETPAEVMGEAITTFFEALGRIDLWDVLPLRRWLPRPAFIRARPAQRFRGRWPPVERRGARVAAGGTLPDDLVTRLMQARDPVTGASLSDTLIHDNPVTFIGAGHETTQTRSPGRCSCSRSFPRPMQWSRPKPLRSARRRTRTVSTV